ncbi:hypothetical protein [Alloactinosynnema sp. L-07]|nr:hypothetical protein [Alloactinosynnema sp. L-07]
MTFTNRPANARRIGLFKRLDPAGTTSRPREGHVEVNGVHHWTGTTRK